MVRGALPSGKNFRRNATHRAATMWTTKKGAPLGRALDLRVKRSLALRELEGTTGFGAAVLLALDHARVAGQEAAALERAAQFRLEIRERLGKAVAHRAGLTGEAAAGN